MNKITKTWWCWVIAMGVAIFLGNFLGWFLVSPAKGEEQISLDTLLRDETLFHAAYNLAREVPIEERVRMFIDLANAVYEKFGKNSRSVYTLLYTRGLKDIKNPMLKSYRYWKLGGELINKFGDEKAASEYYTAALHESISIDDLKKRSERQMQIIFSLVDLGLTDAALTHTYNLIGDEKTKAITLLYIWNKLPK